MPRPSASNPRATPPFHPNRRGFDHFYGFLPGGHGYFPNSVNFAHDLRTDKDTNHYSAHEGCFLPLNRNPGTGAFTEYRTTTLSRDAAAFVAEGEAPFCLFLAYNAPRGPLEAAAELIEKYGEIRGKGRHVYAAMIDVMDQGIDMVVDAIEASGKLDNTPIFFLSDNGDVAPKEHRRRRRPGNAHARHGGARRAGHRRQLRRRLLVRDLPRARGRGVGRKGRPRDRRRTEPAGSGRQRRATSRLGEDPTDEQLEPFLPDRWEAPTGVSVAALDAPLPALPGRPGAG